MTSLPATSTFSRLSAALPFWLSLGLVPLAVFAAMHGGWTILLLPISTWYLFTGLDFVVGLDTKNPDPATPESQLFWYKLITLLWVPVQLITIFGLMIYVVATDHLSLFEQWALFAGLGILSGTIGITYAHELMHQKPKSERWLADILLASVLYSHFRSEHLLVHHRYVATPRDPVTARYGESFWRFFPRVLYQCLTSAFNAEKAMLARKGLPWFHRSNPFWRYWALQTFMLLLAVLIGGFEGLLLFLADGQRTQRLLHPKHGVPKRYEATVSGAIPDDLGERLRVVPFKKRTAIAFEVDDAVRQAWLRDHLDLLPGLRPEPPT